MIYYTFLFSFPFMKNIIWQGRSQEPVWSVVAILFFPSVVQRIQTMSWMCRVSISPMDDNEVCPLNFVMYSFGTVEEVRSQPSLHSSLGFPETQEPQQISIRVKLLVVKVPFRVSKSVFSQITTWSKLFYLKKTLSSIYSLCGCAVGCI